MELHIAIKNILKYQGDDFLFDERMINALIDFQAFGSHPALKNIFKTLFNDGYIIKISKTNMSDSQYNKIKSDIVREYAFPDSIIEYIMQSVLYGINKISKITVLNNNVQPRPQSQPQPKPSTSIPNLNKSWKDLSVEEREKFLNSVVKIRQSSCGLRYDSVYIADDSNDNKICFDINYEVSGRLPKDTYVNISYAIYDKSNRLRKTEILTSTLGDMKSKSYHLIDNSYVELNFKYHDIGKILIYFQEFD